MVDNVICYGTVIKNEDSTSQSLDRFYRLAADEPKVSTTALQTVGVKGHDGFAVALVTADPYVGFGRRPFCSRRLNFTERVAVLSVRPVRVPWGSRITPALPGSAELQSRPDLHDGPIFLAQTSPRPTAAFSRSQKQLTG